MKAKLIYNTEEPEGKMDLLMALKSSDMANALWDMDNYLRNEAKYNENEHAEKMREKFHEILDSHEITLNDIIK